jgi:FAD/FMN-containing dehydrogenase
MKSGFLTELSDGLVDALVDEYEPRENFSAYLWQQGGAIGDRSPTDTAFTHRDMVATIMISGWWMDRGDADSNVTDIRANWDTVKEYTKGFYVNLNEADQQKTNSNYGVNFSRLQAIKREVDPGNLFRLNANIEPA